MTVFCLSGSRRLTLGAAVLILAACPMTAPLAAPAVSTSSPSSPSTSPMSSTPPVSTAAPVIPPAGDDPYLWLEEVQGEKALDWVRGRNRVSEATLEADARFAPTRDAIRRILDSAERIPQISRRGDWLYNLWQDAANPRGLWRRTTWAEYRKPQPAWEVVLDLDALGKAEGKSWVWAGATCFGPDYRRCLLKLSPGGSDAAVIREFDTVSKAFVEGGFVVPEAKTQVAWEDENTLLVASDFGAGSLTDSGYARLVKRWKRGQPLGAAETVFEGRQTDVSVWMAVDRTPGFERTIVGRSTDFYNTEKFLLAGPDRRTLQRIELPSDASLSFWRERALISLRSAWQPAGAGQPFPPGSLLVADAAPVLAGRPQPQALFTPTANRSLEGYATTRERVVLTVMQDVASRLEILTPQPGAGGGGGAGGAGGWATRVAPLPTTGTVSAGPLHDPMLREDAWAEQLLVSYTDFLTPDSLQLLAADREAAPERLKTRPTFFDATGMKVEQRFATSKDGTRVPYFIVWPKAPRADGRNPTLLYGYGGFEVSLQPFYSAASGTAWVSQGGVYVLANIRGGGEYGPTWHQAALLGNRQRAYEDFAAVAEDLIRTKVTTPEHLGIQGGSNGGLLVGAVMLQRPELFRAVVCQVPLLDMRRYHRLLAGASWMAEYGNPDDPAQWDFISRYSPYQNVPPATGAGGRKLPTTLLVTSTKDDRVHPGHARKMAARLAERGHEVLYWENIEGGHGGAADNGQRAQMMALEYTFLWQQLGLRAAPESGTAR